MNLRERLQEFQECLEDSKYEKPQTVGTALVRKVGPEVYITKVELDIPTKGPFTDLSLEIACVPAGLFREGCVAEIIVRRFRGGIIPSFDDLAMQRNGGYCRVAIRPFKPDNFGKNLDDPYEAVMFLQNVKNPVNHQSFYKRFLPQDYERFKKEGEKLARIFGSRKK